jgi:two-component system chemotaxis response regulator CheY
MFVTLRLTARQILDPSSKNGHADRKKRVIRSALVVDDSRVMRKVIINILHGIGIEKISEAENGLEGLTQLKKSVPDLVISDWNMPEMTGIEMIHAIRKCPEYNSIPIAMVTTETGQQEVAEARAAGADAHLCKPFSVEAMNRMIASIQDGDPH